MLSSLKSRDRDSRVTRLIFVSILLLVFIAVPVAKKYSTSSATAFTSCKFGSLQVFDVQWNITGSTLNVSNLDYPVYGLTLNRLNAASYAAGDYFQFFPSVSVPGTYGLQMYDAIGSPKSFLDSTGSFQAIGTDFIFYNGENNWGTLVTTTQGFSLGSSASLAITNASPTDSDLTAYSTCSSSLLGVPTASPSPSASVAPPIPAPSQLGYITSIYPVQSPINTDTLVTITGFFPSTVSNISIGGNFLPAGSWSQSSSTITFHDLSHLASTHSIQIFNGQTPLLSEVSISFVDSPSTPTPSAIPTASASPTQPSSPSPTSSPVSNPFVINPNLSLTGLVLDGTSWKLSLAGLGNDGTPLPLNSLSQIVLINGGLVFTQGSGFAPNTPVEIYIFSSPTHLGTLQTNSNGSFQGSLALPSNLPVGNHTLKVDGISPDQTIRSATVGVLVTDTPAKPRPTPSATNQGASRVVPFEFAKSGIGSLQESALQGMKLPHSGTLVINGYASSTSREDDIRISLDRALNAKAWILKRYPSLNILTYGRGAKKNTLCEVSSNQCAVVSVKP